MNILVSIIVPVYNAEMHLKTCIESLLSQVHKNIQIILINDGSRDESLDLCRKYELTHKNIILINQSNLGVSKARNVGISHAQGEYILFVDSDDWVSPTYVSDLLSKAEQEKSDFVLSGIVCESTPPSNLLPKRFDSVKIPSMSFLNAVLAEERSSLLYSPCVGIYRTKIIKENNIIFPETISYGEDRVFNWRYISMCKSIAFIAKANYHYRTDNINSLTHSISHPDYATAELLFFAHLKFYSNIGLKPEQVPNSVYTEMLDAISNNIVTSFAQHCETSSELRRKINLIIRKPYFDKVIQNANRQICPCFVYHMLKYKLSALLAFVLFIRKRKIQNRTSNYSQEKVIVLSHPLRNNYGGCIQAYALTKVLEQLGTNSFLYGFHRPRKNYSLYQLKNAFKKLLLSFFPCHETSKRTPDFAYEDIKKLPHQYVRITHDIDLDARWIVGSDQVWRAEYARPLHSTSFFFLDFLSKTARARCFSYAASFGRDVWEGNTSETRICSELISDFKAVSVRESTGIDICQSVFNTNAEQMPDPTLLLSNEDYYEIMALEKTWKPKERFAACYLLDDDVTKSKEHLSKQIAEQYNIKHLRLAPNTASQNIHERFPFSIPQWIQLIHNCDLLITDSFHGCVFAILFNKPFVCLGNENRGNTRFHTLLSTFNMKERLVTKHTLEEALRVLNIPVEWTNVNFRRDLQRIKGLNFIRNNLRQPL